MIRLLFVAALALAAVTYVGGGCDPSTSPVGDIWVQIQTAVAGADATPAPSLSTRYVATGDSVAAGEDLGADCHAGQSCIDRAQAFPALLAQRARSEYDASLSITDVSCSGATTMNYLRDTQCGFNRSQAGALGSRSTWVSVTIGADDMIGWLENNRRCVLDQRVADLLGKRPADCDLYAEVIAPFESNLKSILDGATAHASLVIVTQYYDVFSPSFSPAVTHLPYNWTEGVNEGIDLLDDAIANVASQYGGRVVVVDLRPAFATHLWGDADSYITRRHDCSLLDLALVWSSCWWLPGIHPNATGQQVIADEVWAQVRRRVAIQ